MHHNSLSPVEDVLSRKQADVIANNMTIAAGAPATPRVPPKMRKGRSARGIASSRQNQGVAIEAMKIPIVTMIHAQYWNNLNAFSE
jgi:hypothetical protein